LEEPGHRWLTAFGDYADDQAVLDIEITHGGVFDSADPVVAAYADGTIVLEFSDCNTGTVSYNIPSIGRQGVVPIERLALDNVPTCQDLDGIAANSSKKAARYRESKLRDSTQADFQINAGLNDAWWNPETGGQGFFNIVFPDVQQMFLAWFTYDLERPDDSVTANLGDPGHRWLTAFGDYSGDQAVLDIEINQGGVFDSAAPAPVANTDGTITVEFSGCNAGTVTYDIDSVDRQGVVPIERLALDNMPLCQAFEAMGLSEE
jgi:hypothetical protein